MCLTPPPRIDNTGLGIALPHIPLATLVGYVAPEGLDHEVDSWAFGRMVPEYTPLLTLAFEVQNWMWECT